MGIAERRKRERERRHSDIVDAAERVFFAKGWSATTMDDVAGEAELAKATLYLYFKSKEEIYAAILLRGSRILNAAFRHAVSGDYPGLRKVERIGRAYIAFAREHPNYFGAMLHFESKGLGATDAHSCTRDCESLREDTMALVAGSVADGIRDGSIRAGLDPMEVALLLWAETTGLLQVLSVAGGDIETYFQVRAEQLIETYFDFTHYSLAMAPSSADGRAGGSNAGEARE